MPKLSEMFPSKYLQAADVEGQAYTLTVERLMLEDVADGEKKWIIHFREAQKGLVLNRTNANTLEWLYGSESDAWVGKQIVLFTEMTSYMGKPCLGIRMRGPNAPAHAGQSAQVQTPLGGAQPAPAPPNGQGMGPGEQAAARVQQEAGQTMPKDPSDMSDDIPF